MKECETLLLANNRWFSPIHFPYGISLQRGYDYHKVRLGNLQKSHMDIGAVLHRGTRGNAFGHMRYRSLIKPFFVLNNQNHGVLGNLFAVSFAIILFSNCSFSFWMSTYTSFHSSDHHSIQIFDKIKRNYFCDNKSNMILVNQ